ncbi:PepSY domain-containing protein [Nocardia miyunensis]|uniref:PepSY domain-containing protein n=1 Tax=Nocardia miyunensis TaxID=282684 RepID=UPI000AF0A4E5|nr:PepSY domain-containing protein [Nocardia miyunensis]
MSTTNPPIPDATAEPPTESTTAASDDSQVTRPSAQADAALADDHASLSKSTPHADQANGPHTAPIGTSPEGHPGEPLEQPTGSIATAGVACETPADADLDAAQDVTSNTTARSVEPFAARANSRNALVALAMRLHFYAGVFVGPFILIAALTGALYSISPTVESIVNRGLLHVDSSGPARPLADQVAAATAQEPKLVLAAVDPAQHARDTTRVLFSDPLLGESEKRAVFVDPVTAKPVGASVVYGSTGALPLRTWIDQLHRNLHLGQPGRLYSETAASWLWVVALAGLVVWMRRAGARYRGLRRLTWPDLGRKGRLRTMNWHAAVGVWVLVPLLFLSATGMTWSTYAGAHVDALRARLSWTTPSVSTALPGSGTKPGTTSSMPGMDMPGMDMPGMSMPGMDMSSGTSGGMQPPSTDRIAQVDKVFAVARGHHVDGPVEITIPAADHTAFVVKERRISGVLTQDAIAVDGVTGDVTDTVRYADWPLMAKLANWGIALHMGMMFGLANQLLLLLTMIALITVVVRGYLMWWRRRPQRTPRFPFGTPPRRGVLREIHPAILAGLLVIAAAIGWFAPMLGITLLGFLIIDIAIGAVRHLRTTT